MNIKDWARTNFKELLAVYLLYVILFNMVVPQSSLISGGKDAELHGALKLPVKGMAYEGSLNCWNSTKESVNGLYLICHFAISKKGFVSRGIIVKFSSSSSESFRIEAVRDDLIVKVPPNFIGNETLKITINTYDVWWIGIIIQHRTSTVLVLNCTETKCALSYITKE
ncbi:hypothetical protein [Thermococcus thermotolerans]|uniref:hypothetical protein n=1 Tax=Thermococcus thermotolerans TaxID=2969672 RepID=UPI0021570076|nr:hypothetical protein [Thermococcus thermotolerans]